MSDKYGRLTILEYLPKSQVKCLCDCGTIKIFKMSNITLGKTKSCGCLNKENITKHNMCRTRTYKTWESMLSRCANVNNARYQHYGGRGISVCDEWLDFTNFYKDMGDRPKGMTLDRIDVNGNYCKENCRWATPLEQANNRQNSYHIIYNGDTYNISELSELFNIPHTCLYNRIVRYNWPQERWNEPVEVHKR